MKSKALHGKSILITGASRGIGREIALRCARDGANLILGAKTMDSDPKLPGSLQSVAKEVEEAGGRAVTVKVDVRDEAQVHELVETGAREFGGIDALINNAGAIFLASTAETPMKRFDLMHQVNVRAVFLCTQACLPYLKQSENPHVINLSPPFSTDPKWYAPHVGYSLSKYGMTLCTLGMAAEFQALGISVNSLWPRKIIGTAATKMLLGEKGMVAARKPAIMADAAYEILITPAKQLTGQTLIDEDFLKTRGVKDFAQYDSAPGVKPLPDLFVD